MEWADLVDHQVFKMPISYMNLQCRDLQWLLDINLPFRDKDWTRDINLLSVDRKILNLGDWESLPRN